MSSWEYFWCFELVYPSPDLFDYKEDNTTGNDFSEWHGSLNPNEFESEMSLNSYELDVDMEQLYCDDVLIFDEYPSEEFEDDPVFGVSGDLDGIPIYDEFEEEFSFDIE